MSREIEAKFLQINVEATCDKLKEVGATMKSPMRLMRRVMIKTNKMIKDDSFLHVRDEGGKITMTYKKFNEQVIDGCEEIEIAVSDFEKTIELLGVLELRSVT